MNWVYFVSWQASSACGRLEVTLDSPVVYIEDIATMEKVINKETGLIVSVMNFQLLRKKLVEVMPL